MAITVEMARAMALAWQEIGPGVVRNAKNPHFGNNYADLGAVCELVKPALAKHGLVFWQCPAEIRDGSVLLKASLIHESGGSLDYETWVPLGDKRTPQTFGSTVTYGRRYQLKAIFGLADTDDDGEAASKSSPDASGLLARISAAKSREELNALFKEVEACEDNDVRLAFRAARTAYKAK